MTVVAEGSRRSSMTLAEREEAIEERDEEHNAKRKKVADGDEKKENEVEVKWNGDDDPEDPHNWSMVKRCWITGLSAIITIKVTFASSIASTTTQAMVQEMGMSIEVTQLLTSLFLVGFIFGPLIWAPVGEIVGRRPIFLVALTGFVLVQLMGALGRNAETILIGRFLQGFFGAAPLTTAGGVIADLWGPIGRGPAMSFFSASVFLGPCLSPLIGGYVTMSYLGWRWVYWLVMIYAATMLVLAIFFLPETYANVLLHRRAKNMRTEQSPDDKTVYYSFQERQDFSPQTLVSTHLARPFIMLVKEPILLLTTIYLSVVYGLLYATFSMFPVIWGQLRGFNLGESGLIFLGVGLGTTIGAGINILLQRHYRELVPKWKGFPPPEERLIGSIVAGPCLVIGIFWCGWTGYNPSIPWYVPAISTVVLGTSFSLLFIGILSYSVEVYLQFASSALAGNTILRSSVGAAFPLFIKIAIDNIGVQWVCTIFGCIAILLAPIPLAFYKYGARIRGSSEFAPGIDLKIKKQMEEEEKRGEKTV